MGHESSTDVVVGYNHTTHVTALAAAIVSAPPGPVLEMGAGSGSTAFLHTVCMASDRKLVTIETDKGWFEPYSEEFKADFHEFHLISPDGLEQAHIPLIDDTRWAVALVDHSPGDRRVVSIRRLRDVAHFVVVHDTETDYGVHPRWYKYGPEFERYKYRTDYQRIRPYTTVLSQFEKLRMDEREWVPSAAWVKANPGRVK